MADLMAPGSLSTKKLVLHFDVNKTITMIDSIQDKSLDIICNEIVSTQSWGVVTKVQNDPVWTPISSEISLYPPKVEEDQQILTYAQFWIKYLNSQKEFLMGKFTEPGEPGERYRNIFNSLKEKLQLPEIIRQNLNQMPEEVKSIFKSGNYFIIPSFFTLIQFLLEQKVDFCICFRSFGSDLEMITKE